MNYLPLRRAITENRLPEFVDQEEARGIGPAASKKFEELAEAVIKSPQSEDQTSRSRDDDGST